jgi:hypothetical protein
MQEMCTYRIKVQGQVDERELSTMSPLQIAETRTDTTATRFAVHTDQSGLIGLIRYLHGQGFLVLSITRDVQVSK